MLNIHCKFHPEIPNTLGIMAPENSCLYKSPNFHSNLERNDVPTCASFQKIQYSSISCFMNLELLRAY